MAFTTLPSAGAKLRASVLTSLITELRPAVALKPSDQNVNNSTTLVNDTDLVLPMAANTTYRFELDVSYGAGTVADFKWAFTFPAGAGMRAYGPTWDAAQVFLPLGDSVTGGVGTPHGGAGVGTIRGLILRGIVFTVGTAGNLQFQWAQNTAVVENTVVKAGSRLILRRLD